MFGDRAGLEGSHSVRDGRDFVGGGGKGIDQGDGEQARSLLLDPHPVSQCSSIVVAMRRLLAFEQCSSYCLLAVDYFLVFYCL